LSFFEAAKTLLTGSEFRNLAHREKVDLFFVDHSMIPLSIHENYLAAMGSSANLRDFNTLAETAECIAMADMIHNRITKQQQWSLLKD